MLTAFKAKMTAENEIVAILKELGYVDGSMHGNPKSICFYRDICINPERAKKQHVRYTLISATVTERADNEVRAREVMAAIDVFAPTEQGLAIMGDIETSFAAQGWETDLEQTITGVDDYHSPLNIYKKIMED